MAAWVGYVDVPAETSPIFVTISGLPFKPRAIRFFAGFPRTLDGWQSDTQTFSSGLATVDGAQVVAACGADHLIIEGNPALGSLQSAGSNVFSPFVDAFIQSAFWELGPGILINLTSWNCDGVTLIVGGSLASVPAFRLYYVAYSGQTLLVQAGQVTVPASGAGVHVVVGFQPQLIEFQSFISQRASFFRGGAATPTFQGYQLFGGYDTISSITTNNGGFSGYGTGTINDYGISVSAFTADGFTLSGVPPANAVVQYLAYADADSDAGFWAGQADWPVGSTAFHAAGFIPHAVGVLYSGGNNGDRYARGGYGAASLDGTVQHAAAIDSLLATTAPWDPTGIFTNGSDIHGTGQETDLYVAQAHEIDGSLISEQAITFDTLGFTLSGAGTIPGSEGPTKILATAVRTSIADHCVSLVGLSALAVSNRHANKGIKA
jgi:hypothetical protein